MAVRSAYRLQQSREAWAHLRARLVAKAKAEDDPTLLLEEWSHETFERPDD
jgi:hypothetical protein